MTLEVFDAHQDLLWYEQNKKENEDTQTGFQMINDSLVKLVVASVFIDSADKTSDELLDLVRQELKDYRVRAEQNTMLIVEDKNDLKRLCDSDQHGLLLHIEGMDFLTPENVSCLDEFYQLGLRSVGLVWGKRNAIMSSANDAGGLTEFGREVIVKLNQLGIIIDLAHANEESFYDVLLISKKPVMVSHGNSYDLCSLPRNFKAEQVVALVKKGGVIGVFFSGKYLTNRSVVRIDDAVEHLVRLHELAPQSLMIGSDFGGITKGVPLGLEGIHKYHDLFARVENRLGAEAVTRIAHANFKSFLENQLYESNSG